MTTTVNTHEAKTQLSRLLALVEKGEEVIIARNRKPVAKLTRVEEPHRKKRQLGTMRGVVTLGPDFFEPLPGKELAGWFGGSEEGAREGLR